MNRRAIILFTFFVQALASGGLFPRIADVQAGLGIDEATLGLALTTAAAGGLLSNLAAGWVVQALGTKPVLVVGIPVLAGLTALVAMAPELTLLFAALLLMGVVFSLTNVAMNVEADRVEASTGRRVMNRCHGFWGAGMLLAALGGTGARAIALPAALHLALIVPVAVLASGLVISRMSPSPPAPGDKTEGPRVALPSRRTLLLVLFGLSGGIAQSGTQNWSVIFMEQTFTASGWIDTLPLSAFLIAMTLGRILADGWFERHGPVSVALGLSLLSLFGALAVVLSPVLWIAISGFAMMGAGTAVLFPLMVTGAARSTDRPAAAAVSAVLLVTGLAMLAAPALMGWVAEAFGLRAAFWSLIPPFLVTLALVRRVVVPSLPSATTSVPPGSQAARSTSPR